MKVDYGTIDEDDLPGYLVDEIRAFSEHHQIIIDKDGFVSGNLTPADASSLGYKLIAWVLTSKGTQNA